jgi:crotonobetainyl-CoA:carnitine CoA-transferase CaiB-like acyl-CoA transferase
MSRGKRSIALDLAHPSSRAVVQDLVERADVLVESFRPGVLERLGYGPDVLLAWNPKLIVLRVSGYGQTGPYRERPGYGKAAEAFAGLLHMTGFPDGPPVFVGFPIADMCTGMFGAFGIMVAWAAQQRAGAPGQVIDIALYESILRAMDYLAPIASGTEVELIRNGNRQPMSFSPAGIFGSSDGRWVVYSAATPDIVRRVLRVTAGEAVASDPRFAAMASIRGCLDEIDGYVGAWCAQHTGEEAVRRLSEAEAVAALVSTPDEIVADPHVRERGSVVAVEGERALFVDVVPRLSATPGRIRFSGPREVGCDAARVLRDVLGYDEQRIAELVANKAVQLPAAAATTPVERKEVP